MTADWEKTATAKREAVFSLIPQEWRIDSPPSNEEQRDISGSYIRQFLSKREIEITETDAVGIVAKTSAGQWTAVEVIKAFCHRAALIHQLTNCLLEIFFDDAIKRAQELDDKFVANNRKPLGMLHGLPVSLKDQFHVKGVETTMGYVGWVGTFQGKKGTGLEKNFERGSSGGEGALIGAKGSPCGFGTDIGGSVRLPAAFSGTYGLRPSAGRIPYEGAANSMDGQNTILSVVGPLATSVSSLRLLFKAIMSRQPWLHDPLALEIPWRNEEEGEMTRLIQAKSKLTFGVIRHDGVIGVHPPIVRAIKIMTEMLQKLGHEIIEWKHPKSDDLLDAANASWMYDGGLDVQNALGLSGEPRIPQIESLYTEELKEQYPASKIAEINVQKRSLQKIYMEYWNDTASQTSTGRPVDAVISPVAPYSASKPLGMRHYGYTVWVNALDYTSVVLPVTEANKDIDAKDTTYEPKNDTDKVIYDNYDPELYHGSPVALQIVGRRLQEEKMLALAEYVDEALKRVQKN